MKRKRIQSCFVTLFAVIAILALAAGATPYAYAASEEETAQKLDEIAAGQKEILADLASMKEELNIIKLRITQQQ